MTSEPPGPRTAPETDDAQENEATRRWALIQNCWEQLTGGRAETAPAQLAIGRLVALEAGTEAISAYLRHAARDLGIDDLAVIATALEAEQAETGSITPPAAGSGDVAVQEQPFDERQRVRWEGIRPLLALLRERGEPVAGIVHRLWHCTDAEFERAVSELRAGRPWAEMEAEAREREQIAASIPEVDAVDDHGVISEATA